MYTYTAVCIRAHPRTYIAYKTLVPLLPWPQVLRGTYPAIPSTFSRDLAQLVRECLDPNPDRRPNMEQLLNSQVCGAWLGYKMWPAVPHACRPAKLFAACRPYDMKQWVCLPSMIHNARSHVPAQLSLIPVSCFPSTSSIRLTRIAMCLQAVKARMNCLPSENSRAPPATAGSAMLETIKVPRNFAMIKGKLPPAQYATDFAAGLNMAAMAGHMGEI